MIWSRHRTCQTGLKLFSRRNFIQTCFKKYDLNGSKKKKDKTKLFALPKFGSLRGSTSASLKIGEILAIRENLASF